MGGDGGVIATKRAYSRGVGKNSGREHKNEGRNAYEEQATRAKTCALTNEVNVAIQHATNSVLLTKISYPSTRN